MSKVLFIFGLLILCGVLHGTKPNQHNGPSHFPLPIYDFAANPADSAKIALGRRLFYDPILSADNTISCASCHSPFNAFAHTDHDVSHGIHDRFGTRNAPALFNLAWQPIFMWDGAIHHLDMQALAPISHPDEMGSDIAVVVAKLSAEKEYRGFFQMAFGDSSATGERVLKSLAQFQLTLVSAGAKYDLVRQEMAQFTEQEQRGYHLFVQHCNHCHTEPLFTNYAFADNGLPVDPTLNDPGRMKFTAKSADSLKFKVPSLRNLSYSYPYMHDGRFKKLRDVLNHYTAPKPDRPGLAPALQQLNLSPDEKTDLLAFLLTLDDKGFVFNPAFGFPPRQSSER